MTQRNMYTANKNIKTYMQAANKVPDGKMRHKELYESNYYCKHPDKVLKEHVTNVIIFKQGIETTQKMYTQSLTKTSGDNKNKANLEM